MAQITAALVKELRDKTGVGMMDCKKALVENDGDIESSVDWLRKKGLSQAAKKAGRVAAEGLVAVASGENVGAVAEVNSETDFVARNETFQNFTRNIAELALAKGGEMDAVLAAEYPGANRSVPDELTDMIATIGENMSFRRCHALSVSNGVVATEGDKDALNALGKQIAMHVAATLPRWVSRDEVASEDLERERAILTEQARASGRPENIIEKMVEGRIRKFYEEVVLLEQTFVIDNETKISNVLENAAKDVGAPIEIAGFVRFALGEGIEKKSENLADEVAATLAG